MTLVVYTARISTRDPDRFDVTRKSGGKAAHPFAPSWAILRSALKARREADRLVRFASSPGLAPHLLDAYKVKAAEIEAAAWAEYEPAYLAEMRLSYRDRAPRGWWPGEPEAWANGVRPNRPAWDALLARQRVVLCCYCVDAEHCHRTLLASILGKLGGDVRGELTS